MTPQKTLQQREQELRALLATPEKGRREVQELAARYGAASNKPQPARTSAVTYILVHEREQGLIQ
jgi:hypothetical protein